MASRLMRRGGLAAGITAERLGWKADLLIHVGVGVHHQEIDVLKKEMWPDLKVVGYEPNPSTFEHLKSMYPGDLHQVAIGNHYGQVTLYEKRNHKDGSSVKRFDDENRKLRRHQVPMFTLDYLHGKHFLKNDSRDSVLLWLDCEGSELDVLKGAAKVLANVHMLNIEMTPKPLSKEWPDTRVVHKHLREAGFFRQYLHTMKGGQYDAIYVKPHIFKPEYCCCP